MRAQPTRDAAYGGGMRLTHLGHACLLVEAGGTRLLIDPGTFSPGFAGLTGLDGVLLTHQHADHVDTGRFPALMAANPTAELLAEPETADIVRDLPGAELAPTSFPGGASRTVGRLTVEGVGELHALNHDQVRRCGNTGFVVSAPGEPTLFHPGDAYDAEPGRQVDVLALPLNAPWCAVRDTLAFARRVAPRWLVPVHDGLLTAAGRKVYLLHVEGFAPEGAAVRDLSDGTPWDVG